MPNGKAPLVRSGLRGFLQIEGRDIAIACVLTLVAFVLRFFSPIVPEFLMHPLSGQQLAIIKVTAAYNNDPGACRYIPNNQGYDTNTCGQIFDEVYFPTDAAYDLGRYEPKSCQWDPSQTVCQPSSPATQPGDSCQLRPDPIKCAIVPVSYFDPEPPLTKLFMTPSLHFFGTGTLGWRLSQVIFGSLLAGLMYLLAMRLRRDRFFAVTAALLLTIDGLAFVESRIGVIDIIAVFFAALAYYAFLLHWQARTARQWRVTLYFMALAFGLAFAAKLTAIAPAAVAAALIIGRFATPLLSAIIPAIRHLAGPRRQERVLWHEAAHANRFGLWHYLFAVMLVGALFCSSYSRYLTTVHDDVYRFVDCNPAVPGLTTATPATDHLPIPVTKIFGITVPDPVQGVRNVSDKLSADLQYHSHECHGHPYASRWYTWPITYHPVLFYSSTDPYPDYPGANCTSQSSSCGMAAITDMGNPAIWWGGILALIFCVWQMMAGPPWLRAAVTALGVFGLTTMMILFHAAEKPIDTVTNVAPGPVNHLPPLFTIAFACVAAFCGFAVLFAVVSRRFVPAFIVLGYMTAWMMWVPGNESRVLFFYHALGMLLFLVLAIAYALTALRRLVMKLGKSYYSLAPLSYGLVAVALASFIFFYPYWTAIPQTPADHQMRVWVDSW